MMKQLMRIAFHNAIRLQNAIASIDELKKQTESLASVKRAARRNRKMFSSSQMSS